jgi:hypothetical protein
LNFANQLILLSGNDGKIVVRQLAPLFLDLTAQLLPLARDTILIHSILLLKLIN